MAEEKNELLEKWKKRIETANKIRLLCLFVAVVPLVFVYFGNKFWEQQAWFLSATTTIYQILVWDILLMFLMSILKIIFAAKYNKILKSL